MTAMAVAFQAATVLLQSDPEEFEIDPTVLLVSTAITLVIAAGIGYWVYKDASKRENNELLWSIGIAALLFFTLIFGLVALGAYFVLRGDVTEGAATQTEPTGESWDADAQGDDDETDW